MSGSDEEFQKELRRIFIADTREMLTEAEQTLLQIEAQPLDFEAVDRYFRFIHTVKGNAESLEFSSFAGFIHRCEDLLVALKKSKVAVSSTLIDLFLEVNDFIKTAITHYEADHQVTITSPAFIPRLARAIADLAAGAPVRSTPDAAAGGEVLPPRREPSEGTADSIRVSAQKVHGIINYFGEQVILLASLKHRMEEAGSDTQQNLTLMQLEKVTYALQRATLSLRMFPLKLLFDQMRRVVRETAKSLGKEIKLEMKGEAIEVDKLVLDELSAPVMHMIRNAIDHGIEASSTERAQRGKTREGKLVLTGEQKSGFLLLKISDDGGGINKEKLLEKAIAKNIVRADHHLSDGEIYHLIFHPGLSTKDTATEISGRGIGMDVVLATIKKLKGACEIASRPHEGTTISIKVPLSLAMFEGTVFRLGNCTYIIPNADYYELVTIAKNTIAPADNRERHALVHATEATLITLQDYLQVQADAASVARAPAQIRDEVLAFVVPYRGKTYAVVVDEFIAQSKVVLKYLGREARDTFGISGATILGDGSVVLIVDIAQILDRYQTQLQQ